MSNIQDPLLKLKNDYLNFIAQANKSLGYNPYLKGVLFALMLDGGLLSQEEIMLLTGYSRSMVSETLAELTEFTSRYPVHESRKKGDKKKYYSSSLTFVQYTKILAKTNLEASETSYDFVDEMLPRLETLTPQTPDIAHVRNLMVFLKSTYFSVRAIINYLDDKLDYILETGEFPDISPYISRSLEKNKPTSQISNIIPESDSLYQIKTDFISRLLEVIPPSGKQRDVVTIYFSLFLEREPVTQDQLKEFTGASRTAISETLSLLTSIRSVKIVKKPRDRKKYYSPLMSMAEYSLSKYTNQKRVFTQIKTAINSEIIPELKTITGNAEEITKIENFLNENVRCYQILEDFITLMYHTFDQNYSP